MAGRLAGRGCIAGAGRKLAAVSVGCVLVWAAAGQDNDPAARNMVPSDTAAQDTVAQDTAASDSTPAQTDPPSRVARISFLLGNVSVEPANTDQFSVAEANYPLTTGDRMYADTGAIAELQTGQMAVRLGQRTDCTVTAMTDTLAQFGLGQGSVHLRTFGLDPGGTVELDTPSVAVTVLQPGDVRVDVDPDGDTTTVTLTSGQVQVDGNGLEQVLEAGQSVRLGGNDPVSARWLYAAKADGLDRFSGDRDAMYESAQARDNHYVSPDTIGAEDLASNGTWETDPDFGGVWYPSAVAVDWQPYCYGHWAWIAPWGWTWVESEPWGFAPFHYGRWNRFGSRWGWIPGPPVVRPIYSPGAVVFVGRPKLPNGGAVTAWFPLGPREPYTPWYHASPRYVNRVNVSNIYSPNTVEVRRMYNQPTLQRGAGTRGGYGPVGGAGVAGGFGGAPGYLAAAGYVNRATATVSVSESSFSAGRPVAREVVRLDAHQAAGTTVLTHPVITLERAMVTSSPSHSLPQRLERPALAMRVNPAAGSTPPGAYGRSSGGAFRQPNDSPESAPAVRPPAGFHAAPPGLTPLAAPGSNGATAVQPRAAIQPLPPPGTTRPIESLPSPVGHPILPAATPQEMPRPLVIRALPAETRPSFDGQRQAIRNTDPGRPLNSQPMQTLRQSQSAGPPPQREVPHAPPPPSRAPPPYAPPPHAPPPHASPPAPRAERKP